MAYSSRASLEDSSYKAHVLSYTSCSAIACSALADSGLLRRAGCADRRGSESYVDSKFERRQARRQ
jgi:hypothetical protein